jgi:uncharacterized cupredoxin-like copper-binding protein
VTRRRVLGTVLAAALGVAAGACRPGGVRTVAIDIRDSRFASSRVHVHPGETVRFVISNRDPIDHEFILGDRALQRVHETGHHAHHARAGEISVPAGETVATTYTFRIRGGLLFGCHLPGHWAYGMHGTVLVA